MVAASVMLTKAMSSTAVLAARLAPGLRGHGTRPARIAIPGGTAAFAFASGGVAGYVEFGVFAALAIASVPLVHRLPDASQLAMGSFQPWAP